MDKQKIIMYDSDDAAKPSTLSGWLSRDGMFFADKNYDAEHMARWSGCTHKTCKCGNVHEKHWTCCTECRNKKSNERYQDLEYREWSGEPLFLWGGDEYFFSEDDIEYWAEENEINDLSSIKLLICEPQYANDIDGNDLFCDILPEDMCIEDVAPELASAIDNVNKVIREKQEIISWMPSNIRTTYIKKD